MSVGFLIHDTLYIDCDSLYLITIAVTFN